VCLENVIEDVGARPGLRWNIEQAEPAGVGAASEGKHCFCRLSSRDVAAIDGRKQSTIVYILSTIEDCLLKAKISSAETNSLVATIRDFRLQKDSSI